MITQFRKRSTAAGLALIFCLLLGLAPLVVSGADTYVGSKNSNKYHFQTCQWAKRIKPVNRIEFKSAKEAQSAGYVPCKVCKPPAKD